VGGWGRGRRGGRGMTFCLLSSFWLGVAEVGKRMVEVEAGEEGMEVEKEIKGARTAEHQKKLATGPRPEIPDPESRSKRQKMKTHLAYSVTTLF